MHNLIEYVVIFPDGSQTVWRGSDIMDIAVTYPDAIGIVKSDVWDDHYSDGWKAGQESTYDF
jgi:hypothetical protein